MRLESNEGADDPGAKCWLPGGSRCCGAAADVAGAQLDHANRDAVRGLGFLHWRRVRARADRSRASVAPQRRTSTTMQHSNCERHVETTTHSIHFYAGPGDAPRWVYVLFAVSIVLYLNLDCIDGKQARRTNSSSPLGQLFDHGVRSQPGAHSWDPVPDQLLRVGKLAKVDACSLMGPLRLHKQAFCWLNNGRYSCAGRLRCIIRASGSDHGGSGHQRWHQLEDADRLPHHHGALACSPLGGVPYRCPYLKFLLTLFCRKIKPQRSSTHSVKLATYHLPVSLGA